MSLIIFTKSSGGTITQYQISKCYLLTKFGNILPLPILCWTIFLKSPDFIIITLLVLVKLVSNEVDYQEVLTLQLLPTDPLFKVGRLFYQNSQLLKGAPVQIWWTQLWLTSNLLTCDACQINISREKAPQAPNLMETTLFDMRYMMLCLMMLSVLFN